MTRREIVGRYVDLPTAHGIATVYYETVGSGRPILFLHTAGADGRQWHPVMRHPLLARYQLVTFDLPAHGRSMPAGEWWCREHVLTTMDYRDTVLDFMAAVGLRRPVVVGCSMGACLALLLARTRSTSVRGAVAFGAPTRSPGRRNPFLHHPQCDGSTVVATYVLGLNAPRTPEARRRYTSWIYAQSAPGVYDGDLRFYSDEWDARRVARESEDAGCPVHLHTGEYDYSCLPSDLDEAVALFAPVTSGVISGVGHFPMVESPDTVAGIVADAAEHDFAMRTHLHHSAERPVP
ncbi:alpha/beta fold hydrolase [Actinophytocola sp.]|uniref:alpha/beta fold hydrolase n=1 Tax=Actinophytocola sp. TaxID=1872138 RepID=UPI003D6A543E